MAAALLFRNGPPALDPRSRAIADLNAELDALALPPSAMAAESVPRSGDAGVIITRWFSYEGSEDDLYRFYRTALAAHGWMAGSGTSAAPRYCKGEFAIVVAYQTDQRYLIEAFWPLRRDGWCTAGALVRREAVA